MSVNFGEEKTRREFFTISLFPHCSICTDSNIPVRVSKVNETKSHSIASLYNVKQQANITATGNIDLGVLAFLVF